MKIDKLAIGIALASCLTAPGAAQLVGERIDNAGNRQCVYSQEPGRDSVGDDRRAIPAGAGKTCPLTPPTSRSDLAAPPAAMLVSQSVAGNVRTCVYGQFTERWSFSLPTRRSCPPSAGVLIAERGAAD